MSEPIYVYIGTYVDEQAAKADLAVVRDLYSGGVLRTYDAAVVAKDEDGKVRVRRHDESVRNAAWDGAAVGALVGILVPAGVLITGAVGAAVAGLVEHFRRGLSRGDLKDLGDILDAGESDLVVISTTEFDREFTEALKAVDHQVKKLEKADAKKFERELKNLPES
ncbi:DUF1269 domain-containing protein [Kribbella sp. NPDC059898]|uniref:DUF1269 domain-containing protein n=1 Tax=Kribbella sp. NPDC059898 TaxID=3346995 RepID=UPI00366376FF